MRIFLHTGVWKTGSTAIQTFLSKNADELLKSGYMIPGYARNMREYNHLFERLVARDEAGIQTVFEQLAKDVNAHNPNALIISSEHFWHAPPDVIERIATMLRRYSDDVRVIAYIRSQDDMWASLYAQQAKFFRVRSTHNIWGNGDYIGPAIAENAMFYHRCFSTYQQVFGGDAISLKVYDRAAFRGGDVVQDFLEWIGVDDNAGFIASEQDENSSLGWKGVALSIWLADRLYAGLVSFEDRQAAGKALRFAMRDTGRKFDDLGWYGKAPECFGPEERLRIRAYYEEDTKSLADTYFDGAFPFKAPPDRPADPFDLTQIPGGELAFAKRRLQKRIAATYPLFSRNRWVLRSV